MGHKVSPIGIRLGITADWRAKWYAKPRDYARLLHTDLMTRACIEKALAQAGVSAIQIERPARNAKIIAHVARPGVVIGKKGELIEQLRKKVEAIMAIPVNLSVQEVRKPELDAKLVAENIAQQLERRVLFRRAMKRAISTALRLGVKGIKIAVSGRLGGVEIARTERYHEGRMPLHTLRADINYGFAEAKTTYGVIGVKVWMFKGEIFAKYRNAEAKTDSIGSQRAMYDEARVASKRRKSKEKRLKADFAVQNAS